MSRAEYTREARAALRRWDTSFDEVRAKRDRKSWETEEQALWRARREHVEGRKTYLRGIHEAALAHRIATRRNPGVLDIDAGPGQLRGLRIGSAIEVRPNAYVKRKSRDDYVLHDRDNRLRNRWGSAREIFKDAVFYAANGRLPEPVGEPW